jgi:hypothetical protein
MSSGRSIPFCGSSGQNPICQLADTTKADQGSKADNQILFLPPKRNVSPVLIDNKEISKKTFCIAALIRLVSLPLPS